VCRSCSRWPARQLRTDVGCAATVAVFEALVIVTEGKHHKVGVDPFDEQPQEKHRATIKEECPKCKHDELEYHTMQLRSADEGQTIFYTCPKCGHTFSTNS
jgi:DNA-directed RNA polymerase I subunit RPA12